VLFIVIRQMAAPNVLATDTLLKPQHSSAVYIVVRNISKQNYSYIKCPLGRENKKRNKKYKHENENERTTVIYCVGDGLNITHINCRYIVRLCNTTNGVMY